MNALVEGDPLLRSLLQSDATEREALLAGILATHVRPIVAAMLRGAFVKQLTPEDSADVESDIILRVVHRLNRVAQRSEDSTIGDLAGYVRGVAYYAIEDHRRRLQPMRSRLAKRTRYVLTHDRRLALWDSNGIVCGLVGWRGRQATCEAPTIEESPAARTGNAVTAIRPRSGDYTATRLRELVNAAFSASKGPIAFEPLVDLLAQKLGVRDEPASSRGWEFLPASDDPSNPLEAREHLVQLWTEIVELPARQRQALLLHLQFDDGESVARELPVLGLSNAQGIADLLDMSLDTLIGLWNALPLDDLRIASLLGLTRQQVINLRKSARERLARRLRRSEE